jgi:hypothetical protein
MHRIAAVVLASVVAIRAAAADTIDHPSVGRALRGSAHVAGTLSPGRGFVSHRYRAVAGGFVKVTLATGAKRPYLRVLTVPSATRRGEGWSTNEPALVVRVAAGDELEIVVTLAESISKGQAVADATYDLATAEVRR